MELTAYDHQEIRTELAKVRSAISIIRDDAKHLPADQLVILERAEYVIRSILNATITVKASELSQF